MLNLFFSFDVEEWSIPGEYSISEYADETSFSREGCKRLMQLLRKYNVPATFFVTGFFAEREPAIVRKLARSGYEIASHAYKDEDLSHLSMKKRAESIKKSKEILQDICGVEVLGFRAPHCKINTAIFKDIIKAGYKYDSSVHPAIVPGYYYNWQFPLRAYYPDIRNLKKTGSAQMLEIPLSVIPGLRFPISWWWMRHFGTFVTEIGIHINQRQARECILYFHPWEFVELPRLRGIPRHLTYQTGDLFLHKLECLIKKFENANFGVLQELYKKYKVNI